MRQRCRMGLWYLLVIRTQGSGCVVIGGADVPGIVMQRFLAAMMAQRAEILCRDTCISWRIRWRRHSVVIRCRSGRVESVILEGNPRLRGHVRGSMGREGKTQNGQMMESTRRAASGTEKCGKGAHRAAYQQKGVTEEETCEGEGKRRSSGSQRAGYSLKTRAAGIWVRTLFHR